MSFSQQPRVGIYNEPETGIQLPEIIGVYHRGNVTPYEFEPGKTGVAIQYRSTDAEVTIYVRALGQEHAKTASDFLNESLAAVKDMEERGKYSNVKIYTVDPKKERPGWSSGAFTSKSSNRFLISYILCKIVPGHLVKIRASTGNPNNEPLQSFIGSTQEIVDNTSKKS